MLCPFKMSPDLVNPLPGGRTTRKKEKEDRGEKMKGRRIRWRQSISRNEIETKAIGTNSIASTIGKDFEYAESVARDYSKIITKIMRYTKIRKISRIVFCYYSEF